MKTILIILTFSTIGKCYSQSLCPWEAYFEYQVVGDSIYFTNASFNEPDSTQYWWQLNGGFMGLDENLTLSVDLTGLNFEICFTLWGIEDPNPGGIACDHTYCEQITIQTNSIESDEIQPEKRQLIGVYDLIGRKTEFRPKTPLLLKYSDGTIERVFTLED